MKTPRILSAILTAAFVTFTLAWGTQAQTQVTTYPYGPYGWTGATPLSSTNGGDGNYRTSSQNPAPTWQVSPIGGTGAGDGGPCALVGPFRGNGKESYLDLVLNTAGRAFDGSEVYSFSVKRSSPAVSGTFRVQENSSGSFTDIANSERNLSSLPTVHETYLGGIILPTSMGNKASVTLRIVVQATDPNIYTPAVYVDDHSLSGGALPIQLASASANVIRGNDVEVAWNTLTETNNYGFEIYRKRGDNTEWAKLGFVTGHGTTITPRSYSYIDRSVSFGKYYYRIRQLDLDGTATDYPAMEVNVGVDRDKPVLTQNYPNPFNPSTMIEFAVPENAYTTLKVYNVLGQELAVLFEGHAEAGRIYAVRFDASNLPSGLYFYMLRTAGSIETKRMHLLK